MQGVFGAKDASTAIKATLPLFRNIACLHIVLETASATLQEAIVNRTIMTNYAPYGFFLSYSAINYINNKHLAQVHYMRLPPK